MKTFLQTLVLSMIMSFSVQTAYAAKANYDRSKAAIQKVKKSGEEHATSAKNKVKAMNHDASRSNNTASKTAKPVVDPTNAQDWNSSRSNKTSKTSIKILPKDTKKAKDDANN